MANDVKIGMTVDASGVSAGVDEVRAKMQQLKNEIKQEIADERSAQRAKAKSAKGDDEAGGVAGMMGTIKRLAGAALVKQAFEVVLEYSQWFFDQVQRGTLERKSRWKAMSGATAGELEQQVGITASSVEEKRAEIARLEQQGGFWNNVFSPIEAQKARDQISELKGQIAQAEADINIAAEKRIKLGNRELEISSLRAVGRDAEADALKRQMDLELQIEGFKANSTGMHERKQRAIIDNMKEQSVIAQDTADIAREEKFRATVVASSSAEVGLGGGTMLFGRNPDSAMIQKQVEHLAAIRARMESSRPDAPTTSSFKNKP